MLLYQKELQTLEFSVGRGFRTAALQHTSLRVGQVFCGHAAMERRTVHIPNLQEQDTEFQSSPHFDLRTSHMELSLAYDATIDPKVVDVFLRVLSEENSD